MSGSLAALFAPGCGGIGGAAGGWNCGRCGLTGQSVELSEVSGGSFRGLSYLPSDCLGAEPALMEPAKPLDPGVYVYRVCAHPVDPYLCVAGWTIFVFAAGCVFAVRGFAPA